MHQRGCNASDEDLLGVPICHVQREVDALGDSLVLEGEQRGDVNSVPCCHQHGSIFALDEPDAIFFAPWPLVLGDFQQPPGNDTKA